MKTYSWATMVVIAHPRKDFTVWCHTLSFHKEEDEAVQSLLDGLDRGDTPGCGRKAEGTSIVFTRGMIRYFKVKQILVAEDCSWAFKEEQKP